MPKLKLSRLVEAWRFSRIPYRESVFRSLAEEKGRMWWGAFGQSRPGNQSNDIELAKRALRIARFDKSLVALFNIVVAVVPFLGLFLVSSTFGLASAVSLSLAVTFGLTTLYAVQTLSSFVGAETSVLLTTLPIPPEDFSLMNLFSFIRSVDYIVLSAVVSQVSAVALLTSSALPTLVMLAASSMNALFAVCVALWFSKVFQRNLMRGGRSKANTMLRLAFILMWGLLLIGVGSLFSIPWYIMPNLENTLLAGGNLFGQALILLYPFAAGVIVFNLTHASAAFAALLPAVAILSVYALLAAFVGRWGVRTVKSIAHGVGIKVTRVVARDFSVKPHAPLPGYILKDLKVASRNPATAFFFALPVLETVIVALLVSSAQTLRATMILDAAAMGAVFVLLLPLMLLTAEGKGLEYTKTLPVSPRRITLAKTLIATATYVPVPAAVAALALIKAPTTPLILLIPLILVASIASASVFEVKLFFKATSKGNIAALLNDLQKLIVGIFTVTAPLFAYTAAFLLSFSHVFALLTMAGAAFVELAVALGMLRR